MLRHLLLPTRTKTDRKTGADGHRRQHAYSNEQSGGGP